LHDRPRRDVASSIPLLAVSSWVRLTQRTSVFRLFNYFSGSLFHTDTRGTPHVLF